jgi:hypothetical protein
MVVSLRPRQEQTDAGAAALPPVGFAPVVAEVVRAPEPRPRPKPVYDRAVRRLLTAVTVEVTVLLVTGVALYFFYIPMPSTLAAGLLGRDRDLRARATYCLWMTPRLFAVLAVGTTGALAAVLVLWRQRGDRHMRGACLGAALAGTMVAGYQTGPRLRWDQLALWTERVGSGVSGYQPILRGQVRWAMIGDRQVWPDYFSHWLVVHLVFVGAAAVCMPLLVWRHYRRP